ncbi:MAG: hemolysin III family protein [Acidimicrobiales bacterium]
MDTMPHTAPDDGPVLVDVPLGSPTRPRWRGRVHLLALWAAVPALVLLVVLADGARARTGAIFYGVGLCAMLAVSVTYHRWVHTLRARARWQRADHATIYLLIAGTYTAISLAVVRGPWGMAVLAVVWCLAATGAALKISGSPHGRTVGTALYMVLGWTGLVVLPALLLAAQVWPASLLVVGGLCYTVGAIGFGLRWPRLRPAVFGYHEVWHVSTLLATIAHFTAIWSLTT